METCSNKTEEKYNYFPGDLVDACDRQGTWYPGVIIERRESTTHGVSITVNYPDFDDEWDDVICLTREPHRVVPRGDRVVASASGRGWSLKLFHKVDEVKRYECIHCGDVARRAVSLNAPCVCHAIYCTNCCLANTCEGCNLPLNLKGNKDAVKKLTLVDQKIVDAMICPGWERCGVKGKDLRVNLDGNTIDHWWMCPANPRNRKDLVRCASCHEIVVHKNLQVHADAECKNRLVRCDICAENGVRFRYRDLTAHQDSHAHLLVERKMWIESQDKLHNEVKELKVRIAELTNREPAASTARVNVLALEAPESEKKTQFFLPHYYSRAQSLNLPATTTLPPQPSFPVQTKLPDATEGGGVTEVTNSVFIAALPTPMGQATVIPLVPEESFEWIHTPRQPASADALTSSASIAVAGPC